MKVISLKEDVEEKIKCDFVNDKLSISEISRKYDVGRPIIKKILEKYSVYEKRFIITWTEEMDKKLTSIYNEFHDINDMVSILGISKDTIKKRAKVLGLNKPHKVKWLTPEIKEGLNNWNGEISINVLSKELNISQETLREYLNKIGKDTKLYRKTNPSYMRRFEITEQLNEDLKNPRLPAWYIAETYGMSETWIHKKRKEIFEEVVIMRNTTGSLSRAEFKVKRILDELDIVYFTNHLIEGWSIDFYLGKKMTIEVQGDYWHSLPKKIEIDNKKKISLEKLGYFILYIKEYEIENDINQVKENIKKFWVSHISNNM